MSFQLLSLSYICELNFVTFIKNYSIEPTMGSSWEYSSSGSRIPPPHFWDLSDDDHINVNDDSELAPMDELWQKRDYREELSELDLNASSFVPERLNA
jgi:hypothetical protein